MNTLRAFSTTAKQFVIHKFTWDEWVILWRDKIHQSAEGDYMIKKALRENKAEMQEKGIHQVQFRSPKHPKEGAVVEEDDDPHPHWTMYGLVKNTITWAWHLYPDGTMSRLWTVSKKEAEEKALPAETAEAEGRRSEER